MQRSNSRRVCKQPGRFWNLCIRRIGRQQAKRGCLELTLCCGPARASRRRPSSIERHCGEWHLRNLPILLNAALADRTNARLLADERGGNSRGHPPVGRNTLRAHGYWRIRSVTAIAADVTGKPEGESGFKVSGAYQIFLHQGPNAVPFQINTWLRIFPRGDRSHEAIITGGAVVQVFF